MYMQEPSRKILISRGIDEALAEGVIAQIMEINDLDSQRAQALKEYQPEPIEIFINSGGGSVTDGFAIIGAMEMSETPIVTYGFGLVASMALAIFVAGDIRVAHRYTRFMYHSISYGMLGHITEHEQQMKECDLLQRQYNSLMYDRTKLTKEKLDSIRAMKHDYYFSAKEAVELGVAHKRPSKPEQLEVVFPETEEEIVKELTERIANAETKITDSSIINTII
ncbi:ATP-dependent Clp protease proteolytic subunit [Bacillus phage Kirov]|uniref:ATP-dependent Clp protease proteolytic subunit n=1 Tax=Bacillus phage Kirov TaxID=2783539 RepID=A0A7U3RXP1_9CAUD|nr:head maturation protease [Bacillus phage Kirov]QOV08274.1 ATP-dependent Clp protease proteolytic subunit [Bacillus phage Kirov]